MINKNNYKTLPWNWTDVVEEKINPQSYDRCNQTDAERRWTSLNVADRRQLLVENLEIIVIIVIITYKISHLFNEKIVSRKEIIYSIEIVSKYKIDN